MVRAHRQQLAASEAELAKLDAIADKAALQLGEARSRWQALEDQWKKTFALAGQRQQRAASSSSAAAVAPVPAAASSDDCVVCLERRKCVIVIPCGHVCLCDQCVDAVNGHCPICRGAVASTHKVFL